MHKVNKKLVGNEVMNTIIHVCTCCYDDTELIKSGSWSVILWTRRSA